MLDVCGSEFVRFDFELCVCVSANTAINFGGGNFFCLALNYNVVVIEQSLMD